MNESSRTKDLAMLAEQFCSVTGASKEIAIHLLEACNGDLEMAVCMHIDGTGNTEAVSLDDNEGTLPSDITKNDCLSHNIRAPIPQRQEQLVDEERHVYGLAGRRRPTTSVFDGFRDFQAEIKQAEERARQGLSASSHKKQTLEDLFRPPIDLMYKGSFHSAKEAGTTSNKWLMVNIQNVQEFSCQVLNRDVWSHKTLKNLIKCHFIFWQVYSDSIDGKRYMQFYNVNKWPCVDVIDPLTGEHMIQWNSTDPTALIELINIFLMEHPKPDGSTAPPHAKRPRKDDEVKSLIEASEESQLEAAIQASLNETQSSRVSLSSESSNSDGELETFSDSGGENVENKETLGSHETFLLSPQSDSNSTETESEEEQRMKSSKGKACVNHRAVIKNGQYKTQNVTLTSDETDHLDNNVVLPDNDKSCDGNTMETGSQESQDSTKSWKDFIGKDTDTKTQLLFRFPDGRRDTLTLPSTSQLRAVTQYISENDIDVTNHEIVTNFPHRNFHDLDLDQTLKEIGFHAQETIFIHRKS